MKYCSDKRVTEEKRLRLFSEVTVPGSPWFSTPKTEEQHLPGWFCPHCFWICWWIRLLGAGAPVWLKNVHCHLFGFALTQVSWLPVFWCESQQRELAAGPSERGETFPQQPAESQEAGASCPVPAGSGGVSPGGLSAGRVSWALFLGSRQRFVGLETTGVGGEAAERWVRLSEILTRAPDTVNTEHCTFIPSCALMGFLIP